MRYTGDWRPLAATADLTVRGVPQTLHTVVDASTAKTDVAVNGQTTQKSDAIDPGSVLLLPSPLAGPYEALAAKLRDAAPGAELPVYSVPNVSFRARVGESSAQQIQTPARLVSARRTRVTLVVPGVPVDLDLWTDDAWRLIRFSVPSQALEIVREDIASVSARSVIVSRPNDEPIKIPSNGFSLIGTVSKPAQPPGGKIAAVVLVGGSGPSDRDDVVFGVPILGEIAGALADAGFLVVRYDKRGVGQSGGRAESASIADYAEDVRAAVRAVSQRKDVDPKRIAVIGHGEGGTVALLAASREKRIAAVGTLGTAGVTGAELALAQQRRLLEHSAMSDAEKREKVETQKKIHEAVITGRGLDQLPPEVRRAVDNAEYQSLLVADPAAIVPKVRQPILIATGELDTEVDPSNADRLAALARQRKHGGAVDVVKLPGVNHLLEAATTGETDEYGRLPDRHVRADVTRALVAWLKKAL